ncbi:MAG: putative Ig domain-containing protein [Acidobacteriota bacterium]|nr:putative Ig domain-containing protein [Acidobacteriota bacterium]
MRKLGRGSIRSGSSTLLIAAAAAAVFGATTATAGPPPGSTFFAVTPCRVLDTRLTAGPQGGPALAADEIRIFPITGTCGVPLTASAVSGSLIAIRPGASGLVRVFPSDVTEPPTNTIAFSAGQTRAGNGLFLLATNGSGTLAVHNVSPGAVDVVFDVNGYFDSGCDPITVNPASLPTFADGTPVNSTLTASGGHGPFTFAVTSGAPPAGVTLSPAGVLSGTATASGSFNFTATATDFNNCTGSRAYTLVLTCPTITVSPTTLSPGAVGVPYTAVAFSQTGAVGGVTWSFTGTLPTGMTLTPGGVFSGTPTQAGTFPITVTATDAGGCAGSVAVTLSTCPTVTVTNPATSSATAGTAFSQTFTQSGGAPPAAFALASGTLPAGLTLAPAGTLSGTPTQTGTFPITVKATDANGCIGTGSVYPLVVGCGSVTVTNPGVATGTAGTPFSQTFTQAGGVGAVTFSLTSGTLPTGLTLAANGTLSGTPTQTGSFPITVKATDANTCNGTGATYTLVISCQVITVTKPAVAAGTVGAPFSQTFTQAGAIGTATFTTTSTLPAGMSLSAAGVLSGTPGQPGTFPIVVKVTDSNGCIGTSALYTLVIACQAIAVTNPGTATGTAGTAFSQTFTQIGAVGSGTFTTASTLPTGLTLSTGGVLSGTPTQSGTFPISVKVTDSNGCTGTGATYALVISCQSFSVGPASLPQGTTGVVYPTVTFTQTGGIGSVTFTKTGTLPTGLNFVAGVLSGTPTQTGSFPITVTATDANGCTASRDYLVVVACSGTSVTLSPSSLATVISGTVFPSTTFTASGGTGPYTFGKAGALPAGMSFSVDTLSGTPTQTGTFPITISATDTVGGCVGSQDYVVTVTCNGVTITVAPATLSSATVGTAYSAVTFTASGGTGPYTFTEVGGLPTGMTFALDTLSGTPTQAGTFPVTVTARDAGGCSGATIYSLVVVCPTIAVTNPTTATGTVDAAFNQSFSQTGGVGGVTFTTTSTLPGGMSLSPAGVLSGPPGQPGTFPIVVKVTDSNGCTGTSATYNLVISCQTINVTNPVVTTGTVDAAFGQTFTQSGVGTHTPATFTTVSNLDGLALSSTGVLSGTPAAPGSFPITVTVTDANGCTGTSATYTLVVSCQTITLTNPSATIATYNTALSPAGSFTFTQSGAGTHTPATSTVASGTLPTGVSLTAAGVLTGTPTQTGTFTITVKATDANGCFGTSASYVLTIAPSAPTQAYTGAGNTQFFVTGAAGAPATPAVSTATTLLNGVLPAGATLTAASCSAGGTLTSVDTSGRFIFTPILSATSATCTYTVSSNTGATPTAATATASLTFTLNGMVWYVNNASGSDSASRGRSQEPLLTIAQAVTNASINQAIFLHTGSSSYAGTSLNKSGLTLWGQGTTFSLAPLTIAAGGKPTINSALTIGADNLTVSSLNVSTGAATGITNTGTRTGLTIKNGVAVTTTVGTAVSFSNVDSTAGGAPNNGINFLSVSSNGAANGISLTGVNVSAGSFTVTGDGTNNASGGTIQNATVGVLLSNARNVSLTSMNVQNTTQSGIDGQNDVTNFSFVNGTINNSGTSGTLGGGNTYSNIGFNANPATAKNLEGTLTVTGSTLTNAWFGGVDVQAGDGTLASATISNNTITSPTTAATSQGQGINFVGVGNASTTLSLTKATIANNTIRNFPSGAGIQVNLSNANASGPGTTAGIPGDATNIISITGNDIQGLSALVPMNTSAIIYAVSGAKPTSRSRGNADISNNGTLGTPLANMVGTAILVGINGNTTATVTTNGNVMAPNNSFGSQGIGGGNGVSGSTADTPDFTWTILNNVISATDGNGILAVGRGVTGTLKVKIQGNTVAAPLTGVRPGIRVDAGNLSSPNDGVCLNISGNTSAASGGTQGIGLRKQGTNPAVNAFGVNGMAATGTPGVEGFVNGLNPAGGGTLLLSATTGFTNCSLP